MKTHFIRGSIVALTVFILMIMWVASGLFMDHEMPDSPIAFTVQRNWLFGWTIVSLMLGFIVMTIATLISALIGLIPKTRKSK